MLEPDGNDPVPDFVAVADVIRPEQLGCDRVAPAVALAALGIDVHPHGVWPPSGAVRMLSTSRAMSAVQSPWSIAGRSRAATITDPRATMSAKRTTAWA